MRLDDLDPDSVETVEQLADLLRRLHVRAGKKSYRNLERWAQDQRRPGRRDVFLSRATITDALRGTRLTKKEFVRDFVEACDVPEEQRSSWVSAWERIAERRHFGDAPTPAAPEGVVPVVEEQEVPALRAEIERLREELRALVDDKTRVHDELVSERARHESTRRDLSAAQGEPRQVSDGDSVRRATNLAASARRRILAAAVEVLVEVDFIRTPAGRDLFIQLLNQELTTPMDLHRHDLLRPQVVELVTKCLNLDDGLPAIAECTQLLDPHSQASYKVQRVADEWAAVRLFRGLDLDKVREVLLPIADRQLLAKLLEDVAQLPVRTDSAWEVFLTLALRKDLKSDEQPFLVFLRRISKVVTGPERTELYDFIDSVGRAEFVAR